MAWNYTINNVFTHHDRQLTGRDWWKGLLSFGAISGLGAVANLLVAGFLYSALDLNWVLAALLGVAAGLDVDAYIRKYPPDLLRGQRKIERDPPVR